MGGGGGEGGRAHLEIIHKAIDEQGPSAVFLVACQGREEGKKGGREGGREGGRKAE